MNSLLGLPPGEAVARAEKCGKACELRYTESKRKVGPPSESRVMRVREKITEDGSYALELLVGEFRLLETEIVDS